jgi:hypothetical protein
MQPPMQRQVPGPQQRQQQQQQQQPVAGQAGRSVVVWGSRSMATSPVDAGGAAGNAGPPAVPGRIVSTGTQVQPNLATNPGMPPAQQLQRPGTGATGAVAPAVGFPVVPPGGVRPPAAVPILAQAVFGNGGVGGMAAGGLNGRPQ